MGHTHKSVFQALLARGERRKDSKENPYVTLYRPQPLGKNCALLYRPDCPLGSSPVHLHAGSVQPSGQQPRRAPWRVDIFEKIKPFLEFVAEDKPQRPDQSFRFYRVTDWDRFAAAIGLDASN